MNKQELHYMHKNMKDIYNLFKYDASGLLDFFLKNKESILIYLECMYSEEEGEEE